MIESGLSSNGSLVDNKVFTGRLVYLKTLLLQIWTDLSFATGDYRTCLHRYGGTTEYRWRYSIYINVTECIIHILLIMHPLLLICTRESDPDVV